MTYPRLSPKITSGDQTNFKEKSQNVEAGTEESKKEVVSTYTSRASTFQHSSICIPEVVQLQEEANVGQKRLGNGSSNEEFV